MAWPALERWRVQLVDEHEVNQGVWVILPRSERHRVACRYERKGSGSSDL